MGTRSRILSFKYAFQGIYTAFKEEPNIKFHLLAAFLASILGIIFAISDFEWMVLTLTIGLVISLELTNTAIETIVDSFTKESHPAAKKAKDVAAGAVLIASITAALVGMFIFLPYFLALLTPNS